MFVESGHGATYLVPVLQNNVIVQGVRRLDMSGKLLTKLLTQVISLKQVKMHDYLLAVDHIKQEMCFISRDFKTDIKNPDQPIEYYALPDPDIRRKG